MKLSHCVHIGLILALIFSLRIDGAPSKKPVDEMLEVARKQFYAAIEDEKRIEPTIALFKQIGQAESNYTGRTEVYIGSLIALRGKHAFLPHAKLKWARRGLAIMDKGLQKSPNDIEALFIHGTTCYYLPFFFRRGDDAQRDFKVIIKLMPQQMDTYDPELIANVVAFLLERAKLTNDEKTYLQDIGRQLSVIGYQ
ncbi:hypothetical protein J4G07_09830 [Candidatus Poribacteria bacterium]|nr:hypothetical protein [Candidatus Poribacteria bacterium]